MRRRHQSKGAGMTNIKALPGAVVPTSEPNEDLIHAIKGMLADAESGLLQSLYATGFRADGLRMSCMFPHNNVYEVVGAIEWLKHQYIDQMTEPL
jgi:hypothetical protein